MYDNPFISIIIPVFNVEKYLHRCLDSVRSQTFTDFECILIDDASPDNSQTICDEYCLKDNRFKVIHKLKNEGLPKARKTGLDNASTNFVMHADSDDWLEPNALEILFNNMEKNDADIVRANFRIHFDNHTKTVLCENFPFNNNNNPLYYFFMNKEWNTLCAALYKKKLFDEYIVPEISIGEDALTNVQIFSRVKPEKLCVIGDIIYNYDCRTNGMTKSIQNTYSSFEDVPSFKYRLIAEKYLYETGKDSKDVISAFSYDFISNAILPYVINKKKIPRKEINIFYKNYWKKCECKIYFYGWKRNIIPIFYFSVKFGELYLFLIKKMKFLGNVYSRIKSDGFFTAIKYYYFKFFCPSGNTAENRRRSII
jgi:glycosyltransferase involved in cell wall biosynthesis